MKKLYLMTMFLFSNPLLMQAEELNQQESLPEVEITVDKDINLDELEEEMIKMNIMDSIKPIPPHPFIVWVRIIGLPIANAYFAARRVVRLGVRKFAEFFHIKLNVKAYEEESATTE
jgi:hypothetical protein